MNLFKLSFHNLVSRPLGTLLCLVLLMLGTGLISLVFHLNREFDQQLTRNMAGISMVVGAKGSPLQLVLSTVYHVDNPTGNISYSTFKEEVLEKQPLIAKAIPINLGDNYKGFPIVGTLPEFADLYKAKISEGELWNSSMTMVAGSRVASQLSLKPGDEIVSSHAKLNDEESDFGVHSEHPYKLVGIFSETGTVLDRLLLTDLSSTNVVHHQAAEFGKSEEITAVLCSFRMPIAALTSPAFINKNTSLLAAVPSMEVNRLLDLLGMGTGLIRSVGLVVLILSAFSIFISLLNSLKDRKQELALMRVLGATPFKLFVSVLLEGLWLSLAGFLLGIALSRLALGLAAVMAPTSAPFSPNPWQFPQEEAWIFLLTLGIGLLASALPAWRAMRTNLHNTLSDA